MMDCDLMVELLDVAADPVLDVEPITKEYKRHEGSNPMGRPKGPETVLMRIPKDLKVQVMKMIRDHKAVK